MSAIAGLYLLDGREVGADPLPRMIGTMPHRSSDGTAVWRSGPVGLAHGAFHTTPESLHEALPLTNEGGTLTITADARIDNREELVGSLSVSTRAEPITDSELILAAYEAWGEGCLDRLVGDFAFAIWDARARAVFCARDYVGTRPLFYYHEPGRLFTLASEIKALLALTEVPEQLNEEKVADYLSTMREDLESTVYEGIVRLPNAHALWADAQGVRVWQYYELRSAPPEVPASDAFYEERFRELFTEAVRCRLRSTAPVGAQLSGGLDSSSVACVAREVLREQGRADLHAFSVIFDEDSSCDERSYIEAVLDQGGVVPHFIPGDAGGPLGDLDEIYDTLDSEAITGNAHLIWLMLKEARETGVRVLLDGLDGDNVVSHGYLLLKELAEADAWEAFAQEALGLVSRYRGADHKQSFELVLSSATALYATFGLPRLQAYAEQGEWKKYRDALRVAADHFSLRRGALLRRHWRYLLVPGSVIRRWRAYRDGRRAAPPPPSPLLKGGVAERLRYGDRLSRFEPLKPNRESVRESQRLMIMSPRIALGLETANLLGASQHVEVCHPFMDRRLVEFCLSLPPEQSLRQGWTRSILRRALDDVLPEQVAWRVGKGMMMPTFTAGLFERERTLLDEHVNNLGLLADYVNEEELQRMYREGSALSGTDQVQLATIATLSLWFKKRLSHLAPKTKREAQKGGAMGQ